MSNANFPSVSFFQNQNISIANETTILVQNNSSSPGAWPPGIYLVAFSDTTGAGFTSNGQGNGMISVQIGSDSQTILQTTSPLVGTCFPDTTAAENNTNSGTVSLIYDDTGKTISLYYKNAALSNAWANVTTYKLI
jgi:hypothetical protein